MPIYAYRCADCGHEKDVLRKLSDPPLTQCPACGKDSFSKQVTAAGFQLKGSGWYVTDFRGGNGSGKGNNGKSDNAESTAASANGSDASASKAEGGAVSGGGTAAPASAASASETAKPAAGTSASSGSAA
ncbi:zinc ribbon domain-containing protein [Caballeronia sp. LZ065]|uniref:FmdB family zinc ribbon protein n=1 Tax=Caballeronia sp. LZ065 TaxID=3038571 RepID=UPI002863AC80|nr:zinc ribbon domain-containing protein [Caballeronia sp. LZ065]MDR5778397.1 zinc ribbon domain-containing protein [Caballeronia sp. LZ065]